MTTDRLLRATLSACLVLAAAPTPAADAPIRILTGDPGATDYWPCFSPDGKRVVFSRSVDGGKTWDLFVVPSAGGVARRFARDPLPVSATRAHWSRRDGSIAFTGTTAEGVSETWIIDGEGRRPRRVPGDGVSRRVLYPAWYPDGRHLAVLDAGEGALKRIGRDGGAVVALTDPDRVSPGMARVSPDGRWIAFAGQKAVEEAPDPAKNAIWLIGPSGVARPLERTPAQGRTPAWSPDGRRIAFQSNRESPNGFHAIFVVNADGTDVVRLTGYDRDANHPDWSPDGKRLVFSLRRAADGEPTAIAIVDAPAASVAITAATDRPDERAIARRVRQVIAKHRLEPRLFTRAIRIDRAAPIPFSHPVLTLNTDYRSDDEILASLIHEQFHWLVLQDQRALGAAVREVKARYPDAPAGPPLGARNLDSTHLHLLVCSLEFQGLERKIGRRKAEALLARMGHYTWIYRKVVDDRDTLRAILARHGLSLP